MSDWLDKMGVSILKNQENSQQILEKFVETARPSSVFAPPLTPVTTPSSPRPKSMPEWAWALAAAVAAGRRPKSEEPTRRSAPGGTTCRRR